MSYLFHVISQLFLYISVHHVHVCKLYSIAEIHDITANKIMFEITLTGTKAYESGTPGQHT